MKKTVISIMMLMYITLYPEWIDIQENSHKQLFENISNNQEITKIQFSLDGYDIQNVSESGINFQKISYWNEGEFLEIGKPELPKFTRLIALPNEGTVSVEIISFRKEVLSDILVYPQQELLSESQPNRNEFIIDELFYSGDEVFPKNIVEFGEPAIMRNLRVVNITVNPFQYNPRTRELIIYKDVELVVNCVGTGGNNVKTNDKQYSRSFESTYKSLLLNYDSESIREDEFHQPNYLFIYPDNPQVESTLQNLIEWKHQKGFHIVSANTSQTGTTLNSIKNYIQNAYDTWENPPEFICLIGDAGGNFSIPTGHIDGGEGDHYYVLLEGNDILADAFIGRLSFNSIFELQTIIYKILHYEKEPYLGNTNWYNKALLVGDPTYSGQSCVNTKISIKEMINQYLDNFSFIEVYSAPWVSQISNGFNEGISYFNYRGYFGMSGWDLDEISNLNNGLMLPVAVLLTCSVGDFEGTFDSRTERFLKAGSPGNPKGAIAAIGTATLDTNTCFNNCVDAGIYYGIFVDNIYHLGGALNRGKVNLYTAYPNNPYNAVYKFSYWNNLMGDPGMEIWTGSPEPMVVTYDSQVSVGSNLLEVMVLTSAGIPIKNAWVTILKGNDEIFSTGYTDDNGEIYLPTEADNTGEVNLTATKHNYIPHLGIFNIVQNDVFVNVFEIEIDDDNIGSSSGNGDNIINPGEEIELNVSLKNFGSITANSISATISSDIDFINITDYTEYYGDIPDGTSLFSPDDFDFSIDSNVLSGSELIIDISILDINNNEWDDKIYLNVEGANLQPVDYTVLDGNNGILDPGETAELTITIENIGTVSSNQVLGILTSSNNDIIIDDPNGYFGNIPPANQMTNNSDRFIISANQEIIPGTQFALELQLYNADGYNNIVTFFLEVGEVFVTDPLGPDSYGYYCYDDGDIGYDLAPVYDWIEIDPNYGGSGTVITLYDNGDMGDIEEIDLPFILKFYGKNYTTMTVCSNGWVAPGSTDQMSFMNWSIPGPLGPSPIIAPFWDDLKISYGNVCYFYDQILNCFIVGWSHLQNDYDDSEETFQVILFDSNHYPTITGDNNILFQYETINNVDQGIYGTFSNHGEYATIGLEDHTGTIGLEYTYSNQYPTGAKILEDEMAILFTTPLIPDQGPFIILDSFEINDSQGNNNGIVNPGETIEMSITLRNVGIDIATNVSAILLTLDTFTSIGDSIQYFGDIYPSSTSTSPNNYSFDVEIICPDQHDIIFDLSINADDYNSNYTFSIEVFSTNIAVSTDELYFPEVYSGYPVSLPLTIYNTGSVTLHVTDIYTNTNYFNPDITSINLEGGESQEIIITVNSSLTGTLCDTLYIISDDPDEPELEISLIAECVFPPEISLSLYSINIDLIPGQIISEVFTIYNTGGSNLNIDLQIAGNSSSGMAASFDGINDYMSIFDNVINTNYFTIEMWALMEGQGGGSTPNNPIFEQRDNQVGDNHSTVVFYTQVNTYRTYLFVRSSSGSGCIVETDCQPYGEWNHYAGVVSPTMIYFYINGIIVDSTANVQQGNYTTSIDYVDLGRHTYSGYPHAYFNGLLDEARIWDYPRSHNDILTNMNNSLSGNEEGLEAYWNFDSNEPWFDLTNNNHNGTPQGGLTLVESTAPIINWLSLSPEYGIVFPDSSVNIDVTFNATDLEIGTYDAQINIYSNDPENPEIIIPIILNIVEAGSNEILYPLVTKLENNYPNPFNPETVINYQISEENIVKLHIYNIKGQLVRTLIDKKQSAGKHSINWRGIDNNDKRVSSGIYIFSLKVGEKIINCKKCLLLK
ncbi:MAG: T9SS type A sorting domain-containing protein [Armatimonadetes bacterium]|nr:T9SS type A sorting domain-containing protein [Armatimonadota bacterium]